MSKQLTVKQLSEIEHLKVHGRTAKGCLALPLFWTASGIELNVTGFELWVEVEVDYELYESWISIIINSVPVARQMLTKGKYWICVFRGMNPSVVKNVQIVKDVQAMNGDSSHSLQIHAVKLDGNFHPIEEKLYKIEFIGDSITSGEGAIGAKQEEDWISMWFSAIDNYAALTANALQADYRIISQSGWGVLTSWDNNPNYNIPDYYEKVCGVLTGDKNEAIGALQENDFDAWQPDIIVVNLGTNDGGAFYSPEWKDEETGKVYKQRLKNDGTFHEEDVLAFETAAMQFLHKLRQYNKNSQIIWAYGMLGTPMMPAIYRAVDQYKKTSGDQNVSIFQLPNMTEETVGARSHPGRLAHERAAADLTEYLKQFLKQIN